MPAAREKKSQILGTFVCIHKLAPKRLRRRSVVRNDTSGNKKDEPALSQQFFDDAEPFLVQ
jgi:hypothetical protein